MVNLIPILLAGAITFGTNAVTGVRYGTNVVSTVRYGTNVVWQSDVTAGLVARWTFDAGSGTGAVDSVAGYTLALNNGPIWTNGVRGGGLYFDGANDFAGMEAPAAFNLTNQWTISAWVKPVGNGKAQYATVLGRAFNSDPYGSWGLTHYNDSNFYAYISASPPAYKFNVLAAGRWSFIGMTYNGTNLVGYMNGSTGYVRAVSTVIQYPAGRIGIGGFSYAPSSGNCFNGAIDEARVYNRPLSESEMRTIWNATK
jgi:hypothetical protein